MKILLVDDEPGILALLERVLRHAGYHDLITAESASTALTYIHNTSIDLILIDIMMPNIDGITACRRIREHPAYIDTPIIMLTAFDNRTHLSRAFEAGATDYITKPISIEELLARVRNALRFKLMLDASKEREQTMQVLFKKIMHEIELAKNIQRGVLSAPLSNPHIETDAFYEPSQQLAGDLYSWFPIDQHRYGVIVLDVMGHGVAASLISMSVRSLLRGMITRLGDPIAVMTELNRHMHTLFSRSAHPVPHYFTAIYLMIDTQTQVIEYVNAGHPAGFLLTSTQRPQLLTEGCLPIGLVTNLPMRKGCIPYDGETLLVLYTDGLLAAMEDSENDISSLHSLCASFPLLSGRSFIDYIFSRYPLNLRHLEDDICLVTIRLKI
ncbi:PP2C family protein-serine/threonine phosphatase [Aneurinibacillus sp. UBA3580]|jgi:sigma-B regulation protein RsbU (phosphoserine phosphatase)|uniref:PP2C family protein-serine/threonine phosphatase n=1 Tax=Aneurinibacillus sp. UBA3580 TaxID=1946041 RepID=UPI00257B925E|nr:fused response regulator/phosphatase [Aneurinibacillus sp. UBA3580]